jgi:putative oxidoreductase
MAILEIVIGLLFGLIGLMKLMGMKGPKKMFTQLGVPIGLMYLIGLLEIIGAIGLQFEGYKLYASILLFIILIGAIISHLRIKDYKMGMAPIVMFIILAINYFIYVV